MEQHYKAEFGKFLKHQYSVERVSGDSQLKISFPQVVEKNDIIICTAQILENSLAKAKQGDEDGITLSRRLHLLYHDLIHYGIIRTVLYFSKNIPLCTASLVG